MFFVINKPSGYQTYEEVDIYYVIAYFITSKVWIDINFFRPFYVFIKTRPDYEGRKEMFYLTMHSTHFIYGYMTSDIW